MEKTTDELMKILKSKRDIEQYLEESSEELFSGSFSEYLNTLLSSKKLAKTRVIYRAGLDRVYAYQLFNGERANPSRDKVIRLAFGFGQTVEESQQLLKISGFSPLYPRNKRDSLIIFALNEGANVISCDELLERMGEQPLN